MELTSIPGVGEKTATSLRELDDPEGALEAGDVAALARAPGVSEGRAARIARAAIREAHDDPGGFAATPRAREVYREALSLLQERTVTDYAASRLETLYPSGRESRIAEVRELSAAAVERDPDGATLDALSGVEPLSAPGDVRVRDRCLATRDAETYAAAREAVPELSVELVEDTRQLAELARGYATVVALDDSFAGVAVDGDVRVEPDALEDPTSVVPERTLGFFAHNRDRLRAAAAVHRAAGLDPPCDLGTLSAALDRLEADGSIRGGRGPLATPRGAGRPPTRRARPGTSARRQRYDGRGPPGRRGPASRRGARAPVRRRRRTRRRVRARAASRRRPRARPARAGPSPRW